MANAQLVADFSTGLAQFVADYADAAAPLTITSITPTTGPATGGTPVTIYGSGFLSGTPEPRFNGVLATDVVVVNDGELTCVTPAL